MNINYLEKITQVYAFVSVDENGEGIVGMTMTVEGRETFMPFVCADERRVKQLKPIAKQISKEYGKTIKLIKLNNRTDIETI